MGVDDIIKEKIIREYAAGVTKAQLVEKYGLTRPTIDRYVKQNAEKIEKERVIILEEHAKYMRMRQDKIDRFLDEIEDRAMELARKSMAMIHEEVDSMVHNPDDAPVYEKISKTYKSGDEYITKKRRNRTFSKVMQIFREAMKPFYVMDRFAYANAQNETSDSQQNAEGINFDEFED